MRKGKSPEAALSMSDTLKSILTQLSVNRSTGKSTFMT